MQTLFKQIDMNLMKQAWTCKIETFLLGGRGGRLFGWNINTFIIEGKEVILYLIDSNL